VNDPIIKRFWEVFHSLTLEEKKQFLLFLTGSDRIPILGMKSLKVSLHRIHFSFRVSKFNKHNMQVVRWWTFLIFAVMYSAYGGWKVFACCSHMFQSFGLTSLSNERKNEVQTDSSHSTKPRFLTSLIFDTSRRRISLVVTSVSLNI